MTAADNPGPGFNREAVRQKYAQERAKRVTASRGVIHDLKREKAMAGYLKDPFTPFVKRASVKEEVDVAIIGAGMAGVVAGAKLRGAGIRLIDKAGGIGGTWYWNRYPGVMCDVESYVYMPMLEEMNYVPTTKYAFGDEIRRHLESIASKYSLIDDALFHTSVEESRWDEATRRWIVRTDRGDEIRARYMIMGVGILNLMKLPVIPGMEHFQSPAFHTGRWNYEYTGGSPTDPHLSKLADKVVGIIGAGASAIQAVPPLGNSAKHVYVFQRTPSAISERGNRPTDDDFVKQLYPGWQKDRMENFSAAMIGLPVKHDLVDDGWTRYQAKLNPPMGKGMTPEEIATWLEQSDFGVMEEHRKRIEGIVGNPRIAEMLKPYYRYFCKRPCFHDEYLAAFNNPKVTLVDCPAGVTQITSHGVIANGTEYKLDCIVYATGFEAESTRFARRAGHPIIGRGGITIEEKWKNGIISHFGLTTRGFPNLFIMPSPAHQSVTTVNYTHSIIMGAEHVAATIAKLDQRGIDMFDVSEAAENAWTGDIVSCFRDARDFMAACTPSRLNYEGHPEAANPRSGSYRGGRGDFYGYQEVLAKWRQGDFPGWELS